MRPSHREEAAFPMEIHHEGKQLGEGATSWPAGRSGESSEKVRNSMMQHVRRRWGWVSEGELKLTALEEPSFSSYTHVRPVTPAPHDPTPSSGL